MNLIDLKDKAIALIVWNMEKEDDVHVYLGKLQTEDSRYYFFNEEKGWRVSLDEEKLSRLQQVSDDLKETLLNADYALSMSMGDLPQSDLEEYKATGMKWHE